MGTIFNFSRLGGTGARKVGKSRPNYFLTVPTGNDRNCTTNCVGMFGVPNIIISVRFSTLAGPAVPSPEKVVKIRSKHFFVVLTGNDKNCTLKSVGTFRALNRFIWTPFSTFPSPLCSGPEKVVKFCPTPSFPVRIKNNEKCVPNSLGISRLSTQSHPGPIFNSACWVVLGPEKVVQIRLKHFSAVLIAKW